MMHELLNQSYKNLLDCLLVVLMVDYDMMFDVVLKVRYFV
jgi:hypothetical protein